METTSMLNSTIENYILDLEMGYQRIPEERKLTLKLFSAYIERKTKAGEAVNLVFICTHNSRRSHISQIWGQVAAFYYGIQNVHCFSGGREATAFNPRAVRAMQQTGLVITKLKDGVNPLYSIQFAENASLQTYSKKYDEPENPATDFCAIMTCNQADANCPFIPGASQRISLPYNDPKEFDDTPQEESKYSERVKEIGTEIFYVFSLLNL